MVSLRVQIGPSSGAARSPTTPDCHLVGRSAAKRSRSRHSTVSENQHVSAVGRQIVLAAIAFRATRRRDYAMSEQHCHGIDHEQYYGGGRSGRPSHPQQCQRQHRQQHQGSTPKSKYLRNPRHELILTIQTNRQSSVWHVHIAKTANDELSQLIRNTSPFFYDFPVSFVWQIVKNDHPRRISSTGIERCMRKQR